ncbi:MAG: Gfo/Idh/MocA family oxidoreductase [Bacteroidales bacterium]|nr:Gfo/Idh/MocA family oxidoreductase [Bacteroidales bacterium]
MKKWNFGVVGAGSIAGFHAKAVQSLSNAGLKGICGSNPDKVKNLAEKYNCKIYQSTTEMLQDPGVDIVTIATPSGAHMEPAIEAAHYGKHVICEKPLEVSLERIDKMIEAHQKSGTRLGGIFNYRFNEVERLLKRTADSGRFGKITNASVYVPWWRSDQYYDSSWRGTLQLDGGGALMNQSIHMVDMLQYIAGEVSSIKAYTATLAHPGIEVEDTATAVVRFSNGALGIIYGSTASYPGMYRRIEISGTQGTAIIEENSIKVWQFAKEQDEDKEIVKKFSNIEGGGGVSDPMAIPFEPHARNIAAFIDSVETGQPFEIDGYEARKSVEIILGVYKSAKTGLEINLGPAI